MANPIGGVGQVGAGLPARPLGSGSGIGSRTFGGPEGASFKDTLAKALGDTQDLQNDAGRAIEAFMNKEPVELHDVMAAVEEAGIALEMLIEVRNQMVEAYRTVVNMQS
jgi:flagellar hook-basal body complex protein FliE